MFSFDDILRMFKGMFLAIYNCLDSIYLFEEFDISVFWMLVGLVIAGIIWRIIAHFSNFGEEENDDD